MMDSPLTFDEYCGRHHIQPGEYAQPFAAYLHEISGGEWDAQVERVEGVGDEKVGRRE